MVDVTSANQTWLDCFLHFFLGFALFATRAFQSHLGCETTMCDSTLDILGMMVPSGCFTVGVRWWLCIDRYRNTSISRGDEDP